MLVILLKVALSVIRPLIWSTTRDMKWLVDFIAGKIQLVSFNQVNISGVIDVKMSRSNFDEKSSYAARVAFLH